MRRYFLAIGLAALVLSGCSPLTEMFAGDDEAPEEAPQEEAPQEEAPQEEAALAEEDPGPDDGAEETPEAETSTDDGEWDQVVQTNFYDACLSTSRGATGYCQCALDGLQERFSQADFEAMEQEMMGSDALPEGFTEVIDACVEEHEDELGGVEEAAEGEWSATAQSDFLFGCIESSGGMVAHCECALDGMQETYTEGEFEELSFGLEQGEAIPPEFDAVVDACLEQHG